MSDKPFRKLMALVKHLEQAHIHYTLASHREGALMVLVAVPGKRWEIEFFGDGTVEVERFLSDGEICGEEMLHTLFAQHANETFVETV